MPVLLSRIVGDLRQFNRNLRTYNPLMAKLHNVEAKVEEKTIMFEGTVKSESSKQTYEPKIRFHEIDFQATKDALHPMEVFYNNKTYYAETPSLSTHPVSVSGTCSDFRFTFQKQLFDAGALIGKWDTYQRKTIDRPQRNPRNRLGICKHLGSFFHHLQRVSKISI